MPDGKIIEYLYDGKNRRVSKAVNGVRSYRYLYEDQLRVTAELDEDNNIKKRYVYGNHINVPDYMEYDGKKYLLVKDIRGSVLRVVESETGLAMQEIEYDDWGKIIKDSNPGFQPFGFAGGLYDNDTNLVRFGARDYDSEIGRWTTKDPVLFHGGNSNLYAYSGDDPINKLDPYGLLDCPNAGALDIMAKTLRSKISAKIDELNQQCLSQEQVSRIKAELDSLRSDLIAVEDAQRQANDICHMPEK